MMQAIRYALVALLMVAPMTACAGEDDAGATEHAVAESQSNAAPAAEEAPAEPTRLAQNDAGEEPADAEREAAAVIPEGDFQAGRDYAVVEPAQPTDHPGQIEVMEIFWYGCPHCYDFEPALTEWAENKPDDVAFVRLPAVLNRRWEVHARAFYTAQALGVLDEIHQPLFDALHKHNQQLMSDEDLAEFFAQHGISAETYQSTSQSFAVENKLRRAAMLPSRYGVTGVPTVIVNGKYRVDARMAQGWDHFIDTINYLVALERRSVASGGN